LGRPNFSPSGLTSRLGFRVAPAPAPCGLPRDHGSELPRILDRLATPTDGFSGCPESRILRRRCFRVLGLPRILRLQLCRSTSSGYPESCFCGWADDDSPTELELCILDPRSRMNLRVQSGPAHSFQALDANSISTGHPPPSPAADCLFKLIPASSCLDGIAFPIPYKVTNLLESRTIRSVDTSAKNGEICGFHQIWCINRRAWLQLDHFQ